MNDIEIKLGDCLDLIRKLENESVDCILTDPPYFLVVTHNDSYLSNVIKGVKSFNVFSKRELYLNDGKCHPTQKPLELMERFILDATKEKDVVMDCFMGSGTTGVACKRNNRRFIGFEISEEYFEIAKERINKQRKELKIDV